MTFSYLVEFTDADTLVRAARQIKTAGYKPVDAFTPFPIHELSEVLDMEPSCIRWTMLIGGLSLAAFAYGLQWWSAAHAYPLNVGGRPLNSWPTFLLVPFEVGMLAAALAGLIAFFWQCSLPRLYHPLFDVAGFERASQDRFFLLVREITGTQGRDLHELSLASGALNVSEIKL